MALKQLILSDKIRKAQDRLEAARLKEEETRSQRTALETREQELIQAREEVNENTTPEEQQILEEQITAWEEQEAALQATEEQISQEIVAVQQEIEDLNAQLEEVNARGMAKPKTAETKPEERKEHNTMNINTRKLWFGMDHQERDAFIAREDIKGFADKVRSMIGEEQRAFSGAELTIPTVVLPMIRQRVEEKSKLLKHVNAQRIGGDSKVTILGAIPEAVWTAMCGKINELHFNAGQVTLDGHKVAGYVPLCNAVKEDSDLDLISMVLELLGRAIGLALDKAILYGVGGRMPMGILTRLARTAAPENYPSNAPAWKDLSESNVLAITGKTDVALFKALVEATGAIESEYTDGEMFWAMNHKTRTKLAANALTINAAGAIVAGVEKTMPIIGGAIEVLNFIPNDVIIGGFGDMYVLSERGGMELGYSEHAHYIEDETIFRGKARYDGMPAIPEAFVAIGIGGTKPSASAVTFTEDKANA